MIINKPLDAILEEDLVNLIATKESEGKLIEYKLELPSNNDADKRELLADISSFSNCSGGQIIFGMSEDAGIPTALVGLPGIDPDAEVIRIEQIVRSGISPRIYGFTIKPLLLSNSNYALIVQIPNSILAPHMVTISGLSRFFTRTSAGKHQMDVGEIRLAFAQSETINTKIKEFRIERISKILSGDISIKINSGPLIAFHVIPVSAFQNPPLLDLRRTADIWYRIPIINGRPAIYRINLDGILVTIPYQNGITGWYSQLFRNGILESVDSLSIRPEGERTKYIYGNHIENILIETCNGYFRLINDIYTEPPFIIFITLMNILGYSVIRGHNPGLELIGTIDRNNLYLPEIIVENIDERTAEVSLRPIFDSIWNAGGWAQSPSYDENNHWHEIE
jgi:hypothetical protein